MSKTPLDEWEIVQTQSHAVFCPKVNKICSRLIIGLIHCYTSFIKTEMNNCDTMFCEYMCEHTCDTKLNDYTCNKTSDTKLCEYTCVTIYVTLSLVNLHLILSLVNIHV